MELVEAGETLEVSGEGGAALGEEGAEQLGFGREGFGEDGWLDALGGEGVVQPVGGLAEVEGDGCGCGWDDAARGGGIGGREPGGMGRDAAPADDAG